jgi:hypothetical protein
MKRLGWPQLQEHDTNWRVWESPLPAQTGSLLLHRAFGQKIWCNGQGEEVGAPRFEIQKRREMGIAVTR